MGGGEHEGRDDSTGKEGHTENGSRPGLLELGDEQIGTERRDNEDDEIDDENVPKALAGVEHPS